MISSSQYHRQALSCWSLAVLLFLELLTTTQFVAAMSINTYANNNKPQRVAIIGGGVAGLSCAQRLSSFRSLFDVTVFDTGRLRPGGRLSSRQPGDKPKEGSLDNHNYQYLNQCTIDHAGQIIPLPDENDEDFQEFFEQLLTWEQEGVVRRFPEKSLCNIGKPRPVNGRGGGGGGDSGAGFSLRPSFGKDKVVFHGVSGNNAIPLSMCKQGNFELRQDVWVSPANGVRYLPDKTGRRGGNGQWKLQASGEVLGYFDTLIIAHNGKCADRIMSQQPAERVHDLLRVNFAAYLPRGDGDGNGGSRMTLNSIYSLSFAMPSKSPLSSTLKSPFVSGYIQNEPSLRFLSCQTRKYPSPQLVKEGVEVWTVLSSAPFAKKHKAPQEFLPEEIVEQVTTLLLQGLERSLGLEESSLTSAVLESRLQLWGAAVPLNTWQSCDKDNDNKDRSSGFLYDAEYKVGVCGDWLVQSSVAGAWTSGQRLARHLMENAEPTTRGLQGRFVPSPGALQGGIASLESSSWALNQPAIPHTQKKIQSPSLSPSKQAVPRT